MRARCVILLTLLLQTLLLRLPLPNAAASHICWPPPLSNAVNSSARINPNAENSGARATPLLLPPPLQTW